MLRKHLLGLLGGSEEPVGSAHGGFPNRRGRPNENINQSPTQLGSRSACRADTFHPAHIRAALRVRRREPSPKASDLAKRAPGWMGQCNGWRHSHRVLWSLSPLTPVLSMSGCDYSNFTGRGCVMG